MSAVLQVRRACLPRLLTCSPTPSFHSPAPVPPGRRWSRLHDQDLRGPAEERRHAQPLQPRLQECGPQGPASPRGAEDGGKGPGWVSWEAWPVLPGGVGPLPCSQEGSTVTAFISFSQLVFFTAFELMLVQVTWSVLKGPAWSLAGVSWCLGSLVLGGRGTRNRCSPRYTPTGAAN